MSTLGGSDGIHERPDFVTVLTLGGCGCLERTDLLQFLLKDRCCGHERTDF